MIAATWLQIDYTGPFASQKQQHFVLTETDTLDMGAYIPSLHTVFLSKLLSIDVQNPPTWHSTNIASD